MCNCMCLQAWMEQEDYEVILDKFSLGTDFFYELLRLSLHFASSLLSCHYVSVFISPKVALFFPFLVIFFCI